MNHTEGGWPASVDNEDEDSMARFRKKVEKDKSFVNAVKSLAEFVETFVMENNSIDIYEDYFADDKVEMGTDFCFRSQDVFRDSMGDYRSVVDTSWTLDSSRFAAAYVLNPSREIESGEARLDFLVWDAQNSISPVCAFQPEVGVCCVECSPTDVSLLVSGSVAGQVALWDVRSSCRAQQLSDATKSHTQSVSGLKWLVGKHDKAFVSSGTDGKVIAWDARNLSSPVETAKLTEDSEDVPGLDQSYSVSCLEYDPSLAHQFMAGTDQGVVLNFNRKYADKGDRFRAKYTCGGGPIICVERNAYFPQLFASCDALCVKLWSEAASDSPILTMVSSDGYFTDMAWSPTRSSCMYAAKTTGVLEVWDLPGKNKSPLVKVKVCDDCLLKTTSSPSGELIACGSVSGSVTLLTVPDYLRRSSDLENELVRGCLKGEHDVMGGKPRLERLKEREDDLESSALEEWFDPPESAESLAEEYQSLLEDFISVTRKESEEALYNEAYEPYVPENADEEEEPKTESDAESATTGEDEDLPSINEILEEEEFEVGTSGGLLHPTLDLPPLETETTGEEEDSTTDYTASQGQSSDV